MVISRKKFQEEIAKAVRQREDEIYLQRRLCDIDNDAHSRMNRIEERLSRLESIANVSEVTVEKSTDIVRAIG